MIQDKWNRSTFYPFYGRSGTMLVFHHLIPIAVVGTIPSLLTAARVEQKLSLSNDGVYKILSQIFSDGNIQ